MKRFIKIILRIIALFTGLLLLFFLGLYLMYNEPIPKGKQGMEADLLANKMLTALNHEAYKNTRYLEWTFRGAHTYKWDKEMGKVDVKWNNILVKLDLNKADKSKVFVNGMEMIGDNATKLIEKAIDYFNNDSFWLVAPYKVFDKGAERSIVELEDGSKGLMITYMSGGSTPGDTYVWKLDGFGNPVSFRMWVRIIPIGGIEASWDKWKVSRSGAKLPTSHELLFMNLDLDGVKGYN